MKEERKHPAYQARVNQELIESLQRKIQQKIVLEKKYRDKSYTAKMLAEELETNTRYIAATLSMRYNTNFNNYINKYRINDAISMLTNKRYAEMNMEEIGLIVGFSNRQSFYTAFKEITGVSPKVYKRKFIGT
ncbi:MAG: helix-turn-helix domain-containing protein [Prevotella sp.]|nr:AraC family transcriptional regulator [Prevotella sp.]MDY6408265.1 helix-turn-helix domain-containing protein [Prevotella sp.]